MISIKKNRIEMTRGDTLITTVSIVDKKTGAQYIPVEGDVVTFAVKHATLNAQQTEYTDSEPLILKEIPTSTMQLRLDPADTKSLGFGEYVYDVDLTYADGRVDTFIAKMPFILTEEVH